MKKIKIFIIAVGFIAAAILYSFSLENDRAVLLSGEAESEVSDTGRGIDESLETDEGTELDKAATLYEEAKEEIEGLRKDISELKESIEGLKRDGISIVLSDVNTSNVEAVYFPGDAQDKDSELININTAQKEELMELPGIGESKAESIIAYREDYGDFESIEEIMNISGIKDAAFEKLKDKITV